jgi:hypothetical protein
MIMGCRATVTNLHPTSAVRIEPDRVQLGSDVTLAHDPGNPNLGISSGIVVSGGIRLGGSEGARIQRVWSSTTSWALGSVANGQVVSLVVSVSGLPSYSSPGINLFAVPTRRKRQQHGGEGADHGAGVRLGRSDRDPAERFRRQHRLRDAHSPRRGFSALSLRLPGRP